MRYVTLLRAVNVGGASLPMAGLRGLCGELGWANVRTYVQSGNVVFDADEAPDPLEAALEGAVEKQFGFSRPAIVRTAAQWAAYASRSPLSQYQESEPKRLHLCLAKRPVPESAAAVIEGKGQAGEIARVKDGALWIYFAEGVGTSKLTPTLLDKAAGSPVTARNFRTVLAINGMLEQ